MIKQMKDAGLPLGNTKLHPIVSAKVVGKMPVTTHEIVDRMVKAIRWLSKMRVNSVNISTALPDGAADYTALCREIEAQKQTLFFVDAGNEGPGSIVYPAACPGGKNVMVVAPYSGWRFGTMRLRYYGRHLYALGLEPEVAGGANMKKLLTLLISTCILLLPGVVCPQGHPGTHVEGSSEAGSGESSADLISKGHLDKELLRAAKYYDLNVAKRALARGAAVDARNKDGWTPLMFASESGYTEMVRLLLSRGSNVNVRNHGGFTSLFWAARNGHLQVAQILLAQQANKVAANKWGYAPWMITIIFNRPEMVKLMIQNQADGEMRNKDGLTPLILAAACGRTEIVSQLLKKGADINAEDKSGRTALDHAREKGHPEVAKILEEAGAKSDVSIHPNSRFIPKGSAERIPGNRSSAADLVQATIMNDLTAATAALKGGASVNSKDTYGESVLNLAAERGNLKLIELLLSKGANLEFRCPMGYSALTHGAFCGHTAVIDILIKKGAKLEVPDKFGKTPLQVAIGTGQSEVVEALLNAGANIEHKDKERWTPLIWAAGSGRPQIARILLERGAKTAARGANGETALDWARKRGHAEVVQLLHRRQRVETYGSSPGQRFVPK